MLNEGRLLIFWCNFVYLCLEKIFNDLENICAFFLKLLYIKREKGLTKGRRRDAPPPLFNYFFNYFFNCFTYYGCRPANPPGTWCGPGPRLPGWARPPPAWSPLAGEGSPPGAGERGRCEPALSPGGVLSPRGGRDGARCRWSRAGWAAHPPAAGGHHRHNRRLCRRCRVR